MLQLTARRRRFPAFSATFGVFTLLPLSSSCSRNLLESKTDSHKASLLSGITFN